MFDILRQGNPAALSSKSSVTSGMEELLRFLSSFAFVLFVSCTLILGLCVVCH